MEKADVLKVLADVRKDAKKRKFSQKFDLVVNLKDIDIKKTDEQIDFFMVLPHAHGKKMRVCALVGPELKEEAEKNCETAILTHDFDKYQKDKKLVKQLAGKHEVFIAQANVMPRVAQAFGRVLGPQRKMPNPKSGAIVPPKAQLAPVVERAQKQLRIHTKTSLTVQLLVGNEDMSDDHVAENVVAVYKQLIHHLPKERNNIKNMLVKTTMGKPLAVKI